MTNPLARRLGFLALAGFLIALPGSAFAQDAAPTDLAAAFPDTLGGADLAVEVFAGPAWLERQDPSTPDGELVAQRTQALLDASGKTIDDLTVASALHEPTDGNHAAVTAVQVAGASAADLVRPTIAMLLGDVANPALRVRRVGSKDILSVSDADLPGSYPRTVYPFGDTVWVIEAEQPVLLEIVDAIPGEPGEPPVDRASELVAGLPFEIGGERRAEMQVTSDWRSLLNTAPGEMFGPQYEDAALDLYLTDRITAEDLWSVLGIWESAAEGVFVVGYMIDGAGAEVMQGVLTEVIVPAISLTSQQPTVAERELGGRDLTVVSDEAVEEAERVLSTYNFFVAGDTVWMVNLASADEAVLTEALEKLPA